MRHIFILAVPRALGSALTMPSKMITAVTNNIARTYTRSNKMCEPKLVNVEQNKCRLTSNLKIKSYN